MQLDKPTYLTLKDLINDLFTSYTYSISDVEYLRDKLLTYERNEIVSNLRTVVSKVVNELDINVDIDIEIRDSKVDIVFK